MITNILLKDFRIYNRLNLDINNNLVVLIGENAVGKTSILESIYLMSTSKSPRTKDYRNMIKQNSPFSKVDITDNHRYCMVLSEAGKQMSIDNKVYTKTSDFIGNLKTVYFSPSDLNLIYSGASNRRNFLDLNISLIDKKYLSHLTEVKQLLKERNSILKKFDLSKNDYLDTVTSMLISKMKYIIKVRESFINNINPKLNNINLDISGEAVNILYKPSVTIKNIEEEFKRKRNYDIKTKVTSLGTQRDDLAFILEKYDANLTASQGQVRSIVVSLCITIREFIRDITKKPVILLLDDVFSEFDSTRQSRLIKYLENSDQTFISSVNIDSIPKELLRNAQIIKIENERELN